MSNVSEASICRVSVQFLWSVPLLEIKTLFVFFILQKHNVLLILWVHTNKTLFSSKWWRLYSYLKWGKITVYFNFPLLLIKINARDLAGASMCPWTHASASTLRTNDLICITHLSYILKFIAWNAWSQIVYIWEGKTDQTHCLAAWYFIKKK